MALFIYAFRDKKSNVLSNHFITSEPWEKVKQNVSISLLSLSFKEKTNPFVLFSSDYELICIGCAPDNLSEGAIVDDQMDRVNCSDLLAASRKAFNAGQGHTSPTEVSDNDLE